MSTKPTATKSNKSVAPRRGKRGPRKPDSALTPEEREERDAQRAAVRRSPKAQLRALNFCAKSLARFNWEHTKAVEPIKAMFEAMIQAQEIIKAHKSRKGFQGLPEGIALRIKPGAAEKYPTLAALTMTLLRREGDMLYVQFSNGVEGPMPRVLVEPLPPVSI